jgi:hypothetical protein
MGYKELSFKQLFVMAIHDISRTYIREMQALGYDDLAFDPAKAG